MRLASTDVTYWPQILPLFITALLLARVKPDTMQRMPFLAPSSPRYAPQFSAMIDTSTGPNDIRPWGADECVVWSQTFPSPGYSYGPRPTAWEGVAQDPVTCETPTPRLWGGWMDNQNNAHFVRLDGDTGVQLDEVIRPNWFGSGYGPYGGAVNSAGDLYAVGLESTVIHIDAETLVLDDIATRGDAKLEAMGPLASAGLRVEDVVVLVDREQGARALLAERGVRLHAAVTLRELVRALEGLGKIDVSERDRVLRFLDGEAT